MSAHKAGSSYEINKSMKVNNRMYELVKKPVQDVGPKNPVIDTPKKDFTPNGNSFHNAGIETRKNQVERGIFGVNSLRVHL